ncbi:MAG: DUF3373 family protein [Sulfurimonadaceae bacterium]|jgi:hypothetical protein|nr:DUF3373 family protein [Sulfurimonadaceae bacterium]
MKNIIALSAVAFLSTSIYASTDVQTQLDELNAKIQTLEKQNERQNKSLSEVKIQSAKDNIKFDVDFRTSYDYIQYKTVTGEKYGNDALLSNRLWLNMGFAPTDTMIFKGQLAYSKAFGASYGQRGTGMGFDTFDWISSETLNDDKVRVREVYWLWTPKVGDFDFTASVGRRPSTNGYLANIREDDDHAKSPSGHVINMEFDGASFGVKTDLLLPGMLFKVCLGRGLSNASSWAASATGAATNGMPFPTGGSQYQGNYVKDSSAGNLNTVDMAGFIFVPYDDGQYGVQTTWYRGLNVPGFDMSTYSPTTPATLTNTGDMDGMAISLQAKGLGDGISDFLDDTTLFASYAMSKTHPDSGKAMFGETESKTGNSIWLGATMPNFIGGKFGLEYNKGSKHWKAFTFGEDTMAASKLNARGSAYEAYFTQPLIKDVFSMQVRYTYIKYDYTGSDGFFGDGGAAYSMSDAKNAALAGMGPDVIEKAQDLRVYFRYRY